MRNARAVAAAVIVVLATSLAAAVEDWPARPVHFIVPFPAGGSTDVGARVVAEYLSRTFGQQIVVENKSGANGNLGIESMGGEISVFCLSTERENADFDDLRRIFSDRCAF